MPVLAQKGDKALIMDSKVQATLYWETPVDLDLSCIFLSKGVPAKKPKKKGFFSRLISEDDPIDSQGGTVDYQRKGNLSISPFIKLDKDSGVGDKVDGSGNEENIHFGDLNAIDYAIIVANIYGKNTNFSQFNGKITVKCMGEELVVPLTETKTGSWCVVALIDNEEGTPKLVNINQTLKTRPIIEEFIR